MRQGNFRNGNAKTCSGCGAKQGKIIGNGSSTRHLPGYDAVLIVVAPLNGADSSCFGYRVVEDKTFQMDKSSLANGGKRIQHDAKKAEVMRM